MKITFKAALSLGLASAMLTTPAAVSADIGLLISPNPMSVPAEEAV